MTVLPGDVILARREGVIVIPAQLAEEVVVTAEIVALKDEFGHLRLKEGVYTPGQIDVPWTDADQGRLLQVARVAARQAADPASNEIEKHLVTARRRDRAMTAARAVDLAVPGSRGSARPTIASSPGSIIQTPMTELPSSSRG